MKTQRTGAAAILAMLGDALHNMTPFRGIGANTASR
jgi:2-polyprenyl-6-methoxyphenol hydroxylase-like FAD-dependent oxidoreductase